MITTINNTTALLNQLTDTPALMAYLRTVSNAIEEAGQGKLAPPLNKDLANQDMTANNAVNILKNIQVSGMILHFRAYTSISMLAELLGDTVLRGLVEKSKELVLFESSVKMKNEYFSAADPERSLAALVTWEPGKNTPVLFSAVTGMIRKLREMNFLMSDMLVAEALDNIEALLKLCYSLDVHLHKAVVADGRADAFLGMKQQYLPE